MGMSGIEERGASPSERVREAAQAGDFDRALALSGDLATEFAAAQDAARKQVRMLVEYSEQLFRQGQAAISQRVKEALLTGDSTKARALIEEKRETQFRPLHDAYIDYKAGTYDQLLRGFGHPYVYDCQRELAEGQRAGFTKWEELTVEDHLRTATFIFALHMGNTRVSEDDEKYSVVLDPCGTGGKMGRTGKVEPEGQHTRIPVAGPGTWQRTNVPSYCAHCSVWNEIGPIDWFGHPQWIFDPWREPAESCRWYLYKDPNDIPAEHWTMFGARKPASLPKLSRGTPISKEEMDELGLTASQRLQAALDAGSVDKATALLDELPKEYVLMIKGLGLVVRLICDHDERLIRKEQAAISEQIRSALTQRDAAKVCELLDRKERQHRGMYDLDNGLKTAVLSWIGKTFGDEALRNCQSQVAE